MDPGPCAFLIPVGGSRAGVNKRVQPTAQGTAVQFTTEGSLAFGGNIKQAFKIDPGTHAHGLQEAYPVFGADVAGVTTTVFDLGWMPANASKGTVVMRDAGVR